MERLSTVILVFVVATPAVFGLVVEPFLSMSGNQTSVVFLDLHLSYQDNRSCSDPDWRMFEVAYSLEWRALSENNLGAFRLLFYSIPRQFVFEKKKKKKKRSVLCCCNMS